MQRHNAINKRGIPAYVYGCQTDAAQEAPSGDAHADGDPAGVFDSTAVFLYIALWNLVPLVYEAVSGIHGIQRAGFCAPLGFAILKPSSLCRNTAHCSGSKSGWDCWRSFEHSHLSPSFSRWRSALQSRLKGLFPTAILPNVSAVSPTTAIVRRVAETRGSQGTEQDHHRSGRAGNHLELFAVLDGVLDRAVLRLAARVYLIIWLGGLQGIDPALRGGKVRRREFLAAGALHHDPRTQVHRDATSCSPTSRHAMQMFDVVMFISKGNPFGQTDVLMYRIYRDGFISFNLGMAGAESLVLGLVTIFLCPWLPLAAKKVRTNDETDQFSAERYGSNDGRDFAAVRLPLRFTASWVL